MNISEKLALQHEIGGVLLFREGIFFRAYNESAYILTKLLLQNLKVVSFQPTKQNKKWVLMCAFPHQQLTARLPNVVKTAYGGHLDQAFDLAEYHDWYQTRTRRAEGARAAEAPRQKDAPASFSRAGAPLTDAEILTTETLELTAQQTDYLRNWQKTKYPIDVDLGFIESLKKQLGD